MGMPSPRSDANASDSAWPQSMPPSRRASRRRSSCFASFGFNVNPSGTTSSCSFSSRSRSAGTAVTTAAPVSVSERRSSGCSGVANDVFSSSWASRTRRSVSLEELVRLVLGHDALGDEPRRVVLAHRRLPLDALGHERLRVRRLVLLVVPEAPVADEVDDDVVAELLAEGECEARCGERGLGVVGVHVDDRDVEALREVARVPGRAPLGGVGSEPDLVVGDDVERPARRVAVERVHVERLRDDALAGERGVAVDQDRERDRRVVQAGAARAIGLLGARTPDHDRVDRLEVARVRRERDLDLARLRLARLRRRKVVLHVAGSSLGVGDERVDAALPLELAEDGRVAAADGVREDVQPPTVRDSDDDLVRAARGSELDRLVEHRHERVEALDRELLLSEERAAEVRLECLDLREPLEQLLALLGAELLPEAARLDRLPEPDALGVVGDVLDLVGDRAGVDLAQPGQDVEQRLAGDVEAEQLRGDARLELRRQRRPEPRLVERGVAHRLRAEGVEPRVQVAVRAVRLDERHRGRDACEQLLVDGGRSRRLLRELLACSGGRGRAFLHLFRLVRHGHGRGRGRGRGLDGAARRRRRRGDGGRAAVSAVPRLRLDEPGEAGQRCEDVAVAALEQLAPGGVDRLGVLEVLLEQRADVARVQVRLLGGRRHDSFVPGWGRRSSPGGRRLTSQPDGYRIQPSDRGYNPAVPASTTPDPWR